MKTNWRPGTKVRTPEGKIAPVSRHICGDSIKVYTWEFGTWYALSELVRADTGEPLVGKPKSLAER